MKESYRVGILGYGFIGRVHAWAHYNLRFHYDFPFHTEIVRVATSRRETADAAATELGAEGTTEPREITQADDVDVVHICTPNNLHRGALLEAIGAGKHIYCDKPLVVTLAEAAEVEKAAVSAGYIKAEGAQGPARAQASTPPSPAPARPAAPGPDSAPSRPAAPPAFGITFHNRFFPATIHARHLVEEGFLGTPLSFRAAYLHSGSVDPAAPLKWKLSRAAGGGVVRDLGSHVLDLVSWLLGPIREVQAITDIAYPERPDPASPGTRRPVEAEDNMLLTCRILPTVAPERRAEPVPGVVEASKLATGTEDELRVELHGSLGAIRFNSMDPHHLEIYDRREFGASGPAPGGWTRLQTGGRYPKPAKTFPSPKNAVGWLRAHLACVASFMEHMHEGTPPEPGLPAGLYIQEVMDAVDRSAPTGAPVTLSGIGNLGAGEDVSIR
ncbi:MAG: Gfo/Idh/MocA family protein [Spirochaetaceae bacterium]